MFGSGENHNHLPRIIKSKCVKSTSVSKLYIMHKDHKAEPEKGRAVATAITSNTTGLSNAVSDYLEALADSIEQPTEVISTEDMLYRVGEHNKEIKEMRKEYEDRRDEKWSCKCCKIIEIHCRSCHCNLQAILPEDSADKTSLRQDRDRTSLTPTEMTGMGDLGDNRRDIDHLEAAMPSTIDDNDDEYLEASMPGIKRDTLKAWRPRSSWDKEIEERGCKDCEDLMREKLRQECQECGEGVDEDSLEMCLLGLDVVGLFPAMKEKNSGKILREQAVKNNMKVRGFKWKEGGRYIRIHKHLTGDLKKVAKFQENR